MDFPPPPPIDHAEMLAWLRERDSNAFPSVPSPDAATLAAWRETAIAWGWISPEKRTEILPAGRDAQGRFAAGNPGKPKGAKSQITREVERVLADLVPDAAQVVSEHVRHDIRTATWILGNFAKPLGRHLQLDDVLPAVKNVGDIPPAVAAILEKTGSGELSIEDASVLVGLLGNVLALLEN